MGPGLHPQYTRADFGQEAVGGPNNSTSTTQRRQVHNASMKTELNDVQEPNDAQEIAQLSHGSGAEDEARFVIEHKVNHEDEISQVPEPLKL